MRGASSELGSAIFIRDAPSLGGTRNGLQHPVPRTAFDISLPRLSLESKAQYKLPRETSILPKIDEIIGEYKERRRLYYYARFKGGIATRYSEDGILDHFQDLVDIYKRKQADGTLEPFDPTASYIHPLDRVKLTISIPGSQVTSSFDSPISSLTESGADSDEEYSDSELSLRRSSRIKGSGELPFSPRKSRRLLLEFSGDSGDSDYASGGRKLRSRKPKQLKLKPRIITDGDYRESDVDSDSSDYRDGGRRGLRARKMVKGKQKAVSKPKGTRPEYGCVQPVEDIDLDYFSDDEDKPLRVHRSTCEKCHRQPAHIQQKSWVRRKGKVKRKKKEEEEESDEERIQRLGGWVRCLKCPVSAHWGCLAQTQRDDVLKAIREREAAKWKEERAEGDDSSPPKRKEVGIKEMTDFICGPCSKGGICMGCMETVLEPLGDTGPPKLNEDVVMMDMSEEPIKAESAQTQSTPSRELLYRCLTCKRLAHYAHLPPPPSMAEADLTEIAEYYQNDTAWLCADCTSYCYPLDKIIAWRPYPSNAVEPPRPPDQPPPHKERLPREYLVKWQDRSYRRLSWVPHMWLVSTNPSKLKNFLSGGTKVALLEEPVDDERAEADKESTSAFDIGAEMSRASSSKPGVSTPKLPSDALPDAERWIPPVWKTVDRVLDVVLWVPTGQKQKQKGKKKKKVRARQVITDEEEEEEEDEEDQIPQDIKHMIFEEGELPSLDNTETAEQWEQRTGQTITMAEISKVVWTFIKWGDLSYDEASWDSPPRPGEKGYDAFEKAFGRYVFSRTVEIPKFSHKYAEQFDKRRENEFWKQHRLGDAADLDLGQAPNLKLMPFQVEGFNWLCNNWWNHQHCILADEMGLGKTVQVTAFLGFIAAKWNAFPALVVVPNSTITNWVREFERWAPNLRVVPFYGEKKSRDVIKNFELFHQSHRPNNTPAKFHVLVTTYECITGKDFTPVFKNQNRWEVLIVDEGQRLKSDSSLLFRKLNELNSIHRVIMTGTPLNNNIRELFNLMNFLNPAEWADLEGLEKEYVELDEERIKALHTRLRPYFLRRIKSEVLQLPAKNEVIVPVSMAPLQKEVYRSILSHNLDILNGLTQGKSFGAASKGKLNNVLMHLRKCLQHPYLYSEDIEPKGLSYQEAHEKLIDASSKLRFLKSLLPKLKERGHRVLLFSQFVIALDVIEDFLNGEGHKYLRLDGNTKGSERQKGMDEFNRPGSDVFVYLLTTRAGGVGINLFSADTVIIFDPDFNPHQDLQAIARAYRYGQKKTCLVFKLMVKDSAEERIMQIGKKKLVLDHLIVQKMDDDEDNAGGNIQSILTYGAQALFEEDQKSRDIVYSDQDILKLIEKTEVEGEEEEKPKEGMSFSFAKIWAADKDDYEEVEDNDQGDSWAQTLQKIEAERAKEVIKEQAVSGRGRRKAAALAKKKFNTDEVPDGQEATKQKKKKKKTYSTTVDGSGSAYTASGGEESIDDSDIVMEDDFVEDTLEEVRLLQRQNLVPDNYRPEPAPESKVPPRPAHVTYSECGLCGERHGDGLGECKMTDDSTNLAEYREALILHADEEDWETRSAAIRAIDEVLYVRGHLYLIAGQPLHPIRYQQAPVKVVAPKMSAPSKIAGAARGTAGPPALNGTHHPGQTQTHRAPQAPTEVPRQANSNSVPQQPVAGPSKRQPSPSEEPAKKKPKYPPDVKCPVCGMAPVHLVKECRVVRAGSKSISQQIERLERDPRMKDTVDILRKVLRRVKIHEMELEAAQQNS